MGNQAERNDKPGVPEQPDLEPERTVDELQRRTIGDNMPDKNDEVRQADAEDDTDDTDGEPAIEQDIEPDERHTPEPPG